MRRSITDIRGLSTEVVSRVQQLYKYTLIAVVQVYLGNIMLVQNTNCIQEGLTKYFVTNIRTIYIQEELTEYVGASILTMYKKELLKMLVKLIPKLYTGRFY